MGLIHVFLEEKAYRKGQTLANCSEEWGWGLRCGGGWQEGFLQELLEEGAPENNALPACQHLSCAHCFPSCATGCRRTGLPWDYLDFRQAILRFCSTMLSFDPYEGVRPEHFLLFLEAFFGKLNFFFLVIFSGFSSGLSGNQMAHGQDLTYVSCFLSYLGIVRSCAAVGIFRTSSVCSQH